MKRVIRNNHTIDNSHCRYEKLVPGSSTIPGQAYSAKELVMRSMTGQLPEVKQYGYYPDFNDPTLSPDYDISDAHNSLAQASEASKKEEARRRKKESDDITAKAQKEEAEQKAKEQSDDK